MKRKEVEDVMGGKDAWANVDKTDGMIPSIYSLRWSPAIAVILVKIYNSEFD